MKKFNQALFGLSLLVFVLVGTPTLKAQDADASVDIEEITVTGSRIKRESIN